MANKALFGARRGRWIKPADTCNEAGGIAYRFAPKHALAQLAMTGCLNGVYYADAEEQLDAVLDLARQVDPKFVAQVAIYARQVGHMKDMPALLVAHLTTLDLRLFRIAAEKVIDNTKMLRTFVQIMRSGVTGRKSLGSAPKRFVENWLQSRPSKALFRGNIGQDPSLADVIKMVHPAPADAERTALYAYLIDKPHAAADLPLLVKEFELFKNSLSPRSTVLSQSTEKPSRLDGNQTINRFPEIPCPKVPFQMLTGLPLTEQHWCDIAQSASWQATRMNLNTFARHGVFANQKLTDLVATRLRDAKAIRQAGAFPYQLLAAYQNAGAGIPQVIRDALQDAMETATSNVPAWQGRVVVCVDVSGSMRSPITGYRKGATSAVTCVQVASLIAATALRKNPLARVIAFNDEVEPVTLNPRDSVMTNTRVLTDLPWGGTDCSRPLALLNKEGTEADLVLMVSDNQSWIDLRKESWSFKGTEVMEEWERLKERNPQARLVCLDLQPYTTSQAPDRDDILNVGGFSDQVFSVIRDFANGELAEGHWTQQIEQAVTLPAPSAEQR